MSKRRALTIVTVLAVISVLTYVATKPTWGFYFDGDPRPCEIHVRVLDSESQPVAGVTAEHILSRGNDEIRRELKPGITDAEGRIVVPMLLGGCSGSEFSYVFGLAKHSESGCKRSGWQFLWGLIDARGSELRSAVFFRGENSGKARILESELLQLPVDRQVSVGNSVFKDNPVAAQFCRNGMVDVSSLVVMIVRPSVRK